MVQTELAKLAKRLREMATKFERKPFDWKVWEQAADAVEQLARHDQQGGITMKCGHPVQCAYPDGDDGRPGCSMCDLVKKVAELEETVAGEFDTGPFGRDAITGPEPGPCHCGASPGCCSCAEG